MTRLVIVAAAVLVYLYGVTHFATHERARYLARQAKRDADAKVRLQADREKWKQAGLDERFFIRDLWLYTDVSFDSPNYWMAFAWPVSYAARALYRAVADRADARSRTLSEKYLQDLYIDEIANALPSERETA